MLTVQNEDDWTHPAAKREVAGVMDHTTQFHPGAAERRDGDGLVAVVVDAPLDRVAAHVPGILRPRRQAGEQKAERSEDGNKASANSSMHGCLHLEGRRRATGAPLGGRGPPRTGVE